VGLRGRSNLEEEHFFFITTTVINFARVFNDPLYCDILIKNIKHYQIKYNFEILAYCIMPSHFHWIVKTDSSKGTISSIMRDIKKYSAWDILDQMEKLQSPLLEEFEKTNTPGQKRQFWMHRFDDEVIRNNKMLWTKLKYIHNNPVEAGLVDRAEFYKYSSARNFIYDDHTVIHVEKGWAGIDII
jgi:putative transposase